MATDSPVPQPVINQRLPKATIKGTPYLWQMILSLVAACIVVIGSLVGFGKLYLERTTANSNTAAKELEAKIKLHQLQFKMILRSIAENKNTKFTEREKQIYTSLLRDISYQDVSSLLESIPVNGDRRDLDVLKNSKEVETGEKVTGLQWNNGCSAQIRFFQRKNMSLDFQKIDVYSTPPDSCRSKVIPLSDSSTATVEICESHLGQRLELIVIQNSE